MSNIKCLSDVAEVDLLSMEHFGSGIRGLDKCLGGMYFGQLIVLTGKRGEGKSTLASWILANALDAGYHIFAYSGELPDYHFRNWLDLQIAGTPEQDVKQNEYGDPIYSVKKDARDKLTEFYRDRAFIYDNTIVSENVHEQNTLIAAIEESAVKYGCRVILVDNLMTAMDVSPQYDPYRAQSAFVKQLKLLAQKHNLVVILIAHPRKEGDDAALGNESVAGSADITNFADVVITYSKNKDRETSDTYQSIIGVTKNRLTGVRMIAVKDQHKVMYSRRTKRIIGDGDDCGKLMCCFRKQRKYDDFKPPF